MTILGQNCGRKSHFFLEISVKIEISISGRLLCFNSRKEFGLAIRRKILIFQLTIQFSPHFEISKIQKNPEMNLPDKLPKKFFGTNFPNSWFFELGNKKIMDKFPAIMD